jgi:succinyl-CoA synthetase alpha subunit
LLEDNRVVALDCKFVLDDAAVYRQPDIAKSGAAAAMTALEKRGAEAGLKLIQLDGNVGVLANGAGLTMTTMDVIRHYGGKPANFLEIGGEAYTKSEIALDLVLSNPGVKSLVINFCGACARTDVMADGVVKAWHKLQPNVPVFFSIHGTGEEEAVKLVRDELGIEPYDFMEDAVQAAGEGSTMIVRKNDRVVVLGITGKQGTFWAEKMFAYGTHVVAGVNPKRAGETHVGVPIFATPAEAVAKTGGDVAVMFIPPPMAKEAAVSAAQAGIKLLVVLTEHIPAQDVMAMHAAAAKHGTRIVGPNTAGLVTPGESFVGIMPAFVPSVFRAGRVGVISRSGSLGTLVCLNLTRAGIGQSAFIGIGGDPMLGTTTRDALEALDKDNRTDAIVIVGEIGGAMEEDAAVYAKSMSKPRVAFIAGAAAPPGKKMGHAGAIVTGNAGSYASKRKALEAAGVTVVDTPSQIAAAVAAGLQSGRPKVAASQ